jgi:hypothetical protein
MFEMSNSLEICKKFPCKPVVESLAAEYPKPSDFISALRQKKMSVEAVQALARSIPKDKAVEWASQSARMAGEKTALSSEEKNALETTEAWVAHPNTLHKAEVVHAAADLSADSPAYWAANAAAFAEGAEMPEEAEIPKTLDDLTGHFAASSVLLSAAKISLEGTPEISAVPEIPLPSKELPMDDLMAEGIEQVIDSPKPAEMAPDQEEKTAKCLEPFLELGIKLAQSVPGWG